MTAILAINPNTTAGVTALVERQLRATAPAIEWHMATGRFGARAAERLALGAPCSYARHTAAKPTDTVGVRAALADKLLE